MYRADGLKVKKTYGTKVTDYLDGFQYENNVLQFLPTAEGYYDFANSKYTYNYTDHLGNVRLSYYKNSAGVLTVIEENNYYPFGLKHTGYNSTTGNYSYQYKYNGKELQETGMYDYGARFYIPDIGRWGVQDELSEKFFSNSNYNYVGNNPIFIFDPDGRDWYYTNDGQYLFNKDLNRDNAAQFFKDNNIEGAKYAFASNVMGNMNYAANGVIYDDSVAGGGKAIEDGRMHNIEEVVVTKPISLERKVWNFVADNIISKPLEGFQVLGYIFYGGFYALPKQAIEEGKAEGVHVKMDIVTWGFKNGAIHKNIYKDDDSMSEADKFDAFIQPSVEALTAPLSPGINFVENKLVNKGLNTAVKTGVKKGIYQAKPKK